MPISTPATQALDRLSISYHIFVHTHPPQSLEQAARERGQNSTQVVRSILFRGGKGDFFLTLMAGPGQISWQKLRRHLGVSRISLATEEEVQRVTGYAVGTVSPFGIPGPLRTLVDESVLTPGERSLGSGVLGAAIILSSGELSRALGKFEIGQFC